MSEILGWFLLPLNSRRNCAGLMKLKGTKQKASVTNQKIDDHTEKYRRKGIKKEQNEHRE